MALTDPSDPRHGTVNGYGNHGCRCLACRRANREHHHDYMERCRAEGKIIGRHGTSVAYDSGCRCDRCREAHNKKSREYKRRRRARLVADSAAPSNETR